MPSIYASMVINGSEGWGDSIPVLWIAEHLWKKGNYNEIYLWDGGSRETCKYHNQIKFYHRSFIDKPYYIKDFIDGPPDERRFDTILSTHFHAPFPSNFALEWAAPPFADPIYGGLLPPALYIDGPPEAKKILHLDLNSTAMKLIVNEKFRPSFPNIINSSDFDNELSIDGDFVCVQLRSDDPWRGDIIYGGEYDSWATELIEKLSSKIKTYILSDFPSRSKAIDQAVSSGMLIDATKYSFWNKIKISSKARKSACSHSGFGLIMSGYSDWRNVMLINAAVPTVRMPPLQCFANGQELIDRNDGSSSLDIDGIVNFLATRD